MRAARSRSRPPRCTSSARAARSPAAASRRRRCAPRSRRACTRCSPARPRRPTVRALRSRARRRREPWSLPIAACRPPMPSAAMLRGALRGADEREILSSTPSYPVVTRMQPLHTFSPEPWRARFPICANTNYLVSHSLGAMPAAVYDKLRAFADQWATRGVRAWGEGWWSAPVDVGNVLAKVLNAPPDSVVMHQNVSLIEALVASSLDFSGPRNKVVYTDQNFPTVMYVWQGFEKLGAKIHVVKSEDGVTVPTERLLEAIDEQTLIVPISHVFYKSSYLQDAAAICARAREVGALVLLDTYQSLGTVPVDVQALGVDMVCGGSVKWLCGGPGAG
ncbi:MAG: aminotransferase class V-fold PLP-dependent enzyme, partial [Planctomycetota bacterium]